MYLYELRMLIPECTDSCGFKLQVVQFWNSIFN